MAQGDPMKWNMPGWRIEQRFANKVLIGNWQEERLKFLKGNTVSNSTHRIDFKNFGNHRPDVIVRRKAQFKSEGVGKDFLFNHHGNKYNDNMISWYDENFNKRERSGPNKLPNLRSWDSNTLSWRPEKTDYPIQGEPTNFGLSQSKERGWSGQVAAETGGDFDTTYRSSYLPVPTTARIRLRFATPREVSTPLHRQNNINKNMHYRGVQKYMSPEVMPSPTASVPPPMHSQRRSANIVY